ncbi:uncharacterized protein TA05420 [Theileria annulata]|uniref:Uncharacterized protein n=1 Tax=Theileria annulata TaxID=5874 RepID=Q4UCS0_THEAN|nr:uncharacterized protein TA05420 [Theileria annulata]CAI75381.1 hypothetical protein TA05420 [Theileria annulata]|eukprot:XP_954857.1 hypothetical protein TA05420 [Theileria annulata]
MELEVDIVRQNLNSGGTNVPVFDDSQNLEEFPDNLKGNDPSSNPEQEVYEPDISSMGSDSTLYNEVDESTQVVENCNLETKNEVNLDNCPKLIMCDQNSYQQHVENHTNSGTRDKNDPGTKDDGEGDILMGMNNENEMLPEGWVRCGNGLKTEFPNTPKNNLEGDFESSNLFIDFTNNQTNFMVNNSVKNSLMSFDRSAVKELKEGFVSIKASKPLSDKFLHPKHREQQTPKTNSFPNGKPNTRNVKVKGTNLVTFQHSLRNNTYLNSPNEEFCNINSHNDSEYKKNLISHVEDLVRKYRQLAIDAVNAARDEQKKCKEECQKAYSTAYNACLKYEKDLKNTVKFALKEYHHNSRDEYWSPPDQRNNFHGTNQALRNNYRDERVVNHRLLKQDLSYNYEVDELLLTDFENNVC